MTEHTCARCGGRRFINFGGLVCAWCGTKLAHSLWVPPEPNPFGNPVIIEIRSDAKPEEDT